MSKQRKIFIQKLFRHLNSTDYLLLKFIENDLSEISENSDLDILFKEKKHDKIEAFAKCESTVIKIASHQQSFMKQLFLHFADGGFLQVDCLYQLIRKDLIYLSNEELFAQRKVKSGINTYSDFCLFEHLVLFHQLNFSGVPEKYINYFESLPQNNLGQIFEKFNKKYQTSVLNISEVISYNSNIRKQIIYKINKLTVNNFLSKQTNKLKYILDSVFNIKRRRGFLVSFSGVDGAGKSTILEATRRLLSEKFRRKTVVIRHRPSIIPILSSFIYGKSQAEKRAATRLPRQGNNSNKFKSFLRFAYYYMDYLLGRSYIFFKYQIRNYIVLYDRYYFDFIVDSKRTNLELDEDVPKWLYRFVQKPKLNFFLYAPVDVILQRKKELEPEAIQNLTQGYQSVFNEFGKKYPQEYHSIKNIEKEETLNFISQKLIKAF